MIPHLKLCKHDFLCFRLCCQNIFSLLDRVSIILMLLIMQEKSIFAARYELYASVWKHKIIMMVYQTYQRTSEPQKQSFNMCHHLLVLEVLHKRGWCSVAKWHLVNHVGVTHNNVPGCLNKKWFLRLRISNIPYM